MTLAELADFVCTKVGQTDTASVAACKDFLKARYRMIWDGALWTDAQSLVAVSSESPDFGLIEFPETVGRVLRLRNTGTNSDVLGASIGTLFDFDSSIFSQTGLEARFIHLKSRPTAFATDVGRLTFDAREIEGDDGVTYFNVVGGDGVGGIIEETVAVTVSARRETTTVDLAGETGASLDGEGFAIELTDGEAIGVYVSVDGLAAAPDFSSYNGGAGVTSTIMVQVSAGDDDATVAAAMQSFGAGSASGTVVTFIADDVGARADAADFGTGVPITVTTQGSNGSEVQSSSTFVELYYITTETDFAAGMPMKNADGDSIGTYTGTIYPADHIGTLANIERVRVYPAPSTAQTYLAHVKTKCPTYENDADVAGLAGVDNALLAFAQGDMLERQRQYAKAAAKVAEGQSLLQSMLEQEKNQQAWDARIIPADIHGSFSADDTSFLPKG